MEHQTWLKDTFIKGTPAELLFTFANIKFTEPTKFGQLTELMTNIFYTESNHETILDVFCDIQKVARAVSVIKKHFRFKRARIYNTEDLYMNPILPNGRGTVTLLQNSTKYVFHIRELIHTMNSSLSHCCHFFADPIVCKNPYTNLPFTKSALYNIYFAIKDSSFLMPTLFHRYFLCNFNYGTFFLENSELINEEFLKTYVENYCLDNVYFHVRDMFFEHNMKFRIHRLFPRDILFEIMKPYLKLYFASNFSINLQIKRESSERLHRKIREFVKFNPHFGKRKVKMTPIKPFSHVKKCSYYFDDNASPFLSVLDNKKEKTNFMTSHLEECNDCDESSTIHSSSFSSSEEEDLDFENQIIVTNRNRTPVLYESSEEENEDENEDEDTNYENSMIPILEDSDVD